MAPGPPSQAPSACDCRRGSSSEVRGKTVPKGTDQPNGAGVGFATQAEAGGKPKKAVLSGELLTHSRPQILQKATQ